jgi:hypothetical protein
MTFLPLFYVKGSVDWLNFKRKQVNITVTDVFQFCLMVLFIS